MAQGIFNLKQVNQAIQQNGWSNQKPSAVEYLVIAGGGGGGGGYGTGGGAGGLLQGIEPVPNGQTLVVTVGAGGTGNGNSIGNQGNSSVFGQISTTGGGYGCSGYGNRSGSGGSGGGSAGNTGKNLWGEGVAGQGFRGGNGGQETGSAQGGGGGAGTRGMDATGGNNGGAGGVGAASAITGTVTAYAGGGGGGTYNSTAGDQGIGGAGGGGSAGTSGGSNVGANGSANTGGGGGGCSYNSGAGGTIAGGTGGSGFVAISYPDTYAAAASSTGATVSTSGSGSAYFNGSTYADYPASTSNYASGDFTVESWVYFSTVGAGYTLWFSMDPNTTYFGLKNANNAVCNLGNGTELLYSVTTPSTNTWYHYAFVRSGTTVTLYINGVSQGTNTSSASLGSGGGAIRIGNASGYPLTGNLSNVRYTKSAVYTGAFTPPTAPLTAIANTRLLLNTVSPSPFNDSSGIAQKPTVTGTSSWSATSPFTGTGYKNRVYTWTSSGTITF